MARILLRHTMDTTISMTQTEKEVVDELQAHLNETNIGSISKGEAVAHAAKAYLQLNRDNE